MDRVVGRTSALLFASVASAGSLLVMGVSRDFWVVLAVLAAWSIVFAAAMPIRQAYLNGIIPSEQRATVLSFDSMLGSMGGAAAQPVLGRTAAAWGFGPSYVTAAAIELLALPFLLLARSQRAESDRIDS